MSGDAYAGQEKSFPLVLHNTGSAPAQDIQLTASPPSGWKVTFEPKQVAELAVDGEQKVNAAGDTGAEGDGRRLHGDDARLRQRPVGIGRTTAWP